MLVRDIKNIISASSKSSLPYRFKKKTFINITNAYTHMLSFTFLLVKLQLNHKDAEEFDLMCEYVRHRHIPTHCKMKYTRPISCLVTVKDKQ